jgi:hypothetical protein
MGIVIMIFVVAYGFAQNAVTLDTALNNATAYLNARIPAKSKVVVLNCTSNWPQLSEYIIEELIGYIVNEGTLTAVDRKNLDAIQQELEFQLSGDVSEETALSIGQKLGAQTIISASITALGNTYRLRIRVIAVETAQIQGMQNVDVMQDSRLAALTGTAYLGPPPVATVSPNTSSNTNIPQNNNRSVIMPNAGFWEAGSDGSSPAKAHVTREFIEGKERDVLNLEVTLVRGTGYRYGQFILGNQTVVQNIRNGTGVRLKVLGDGKDWTLKFATPETNSDYCHYQTVISARRGRVTEINLLYSRLRQPEWGKRATFNKNNIIYVVFERGSEGETGSSTIQIFDFEVY